MGNTLPMARSEGAKQSRRTKDMLLASGRARVSSSTSSRRNKGKKTAPANKRTKRGAAEDITPKGKVSAEAEVPNGNTARGAKPKGHRRLDKGRKPDRGVERKDTTPRRTASELGIEWITDFCPDGQPHILIATHTFDGGSLFKCTNCQKHIWLPTLLQDAAALDAMIDFLGAQAGYRKFLDKHRGAKCMIAKLQDLWYARQTTNDNGEFTALVIKVMEDKEYDRVGVD